MILFGKLVQWAFVCFILANILNAAFNIVSEANPDIPEFLWTEEMHQTVQHLQDATIRGEFDYSFKINGHLMIRTANGKCGVIDFSKLSQVSLSIDPKEGRWLRSHYDRLRSCEVEIHFPDNPSFLPELPSPRDIIEELPAVSI